MIAITLLVPAVVSGVSAQDAGSKVLRVHHVTYPDAIDPQTTSFVNEIDILALAYEGLTRLDTEQATVPAAAESWEYNEDATSITFTLREGLLYSDGTPLTADNFRYAVQRTCDPRVAGNYQSILFGVVGCQDFATIGGTADEPVEYTDEEWQAAADAIGATVVDDLTLQVDLIEPTPYFHTIAYMWVFFPVKQEIAEANPDNWWQDAANHIGNGTFNITDIVEDQLITFEANDNYWQGSPLLDGIEYVYQGESAVALEAYINGDLDMMAVDPSQLPQIEADPVLAAELVSYPTAWTSTLSMNLALEPFDDLSVREAFAYAFDRETYCSVIRNGDCIPTLSWVPEGILGSIETDQFAFDPEAAVAALAESSYGGPEGLPEIQLFFNSNDSANTARAEWVAGQYRDVLGIELTLVPTEGTTLIDLRSNQETFPQLLLVGGWIQDYPDPQNWLSVFFTCDSDFADRFSYCNEEFDALVNEADQLADPAARTPLYEQASQILVDDQPGPFLYNIALNTLVKPNVTGYTPTASESLWPGMLSSLMTLDIVDE
ncbi:MAG: peptide ABC transporter substrate-binding protein [Chloroflexia bacterium]|nr:peptide ABC transporter substrate-binding protein [Chloroflexia bacterium]